MYIHRKQWSCCVWTSAQVLCRLLNSLWYKMSMYKHNFAEIQWRSWSTLDLSLMLISAMQHSPIPAAQFSLVFHYFDGNSPLLSFLKFHEEFVLRNDFEGSKKHLQDFQLCMDKVCSCDRCPCLCVISYGTPNATKITAKNEPILLFSAARVW